LSAHSETVLKRQTHVESTTAKIYSNLMTPFSVASAVSVVFSWFSPIGTGPIMTPFSSAAVGILTLCIAPFVPVIYSARVGRTDLDVSDVSKRVPLYVPGLASYAAGALVFLALKNEIMFLIAFAYVCVTLATFLITFVWKISAHTAGIAGPTTALVFVFGTWILPLYVLSILMIWSRVKLGAHTLIQAVAGIVVAVTITGVVYAALYL